MTTLYGISNCDTVKKARAWLAANGQAYRYHDFKKDGVPPDALDAWLRVAGWETVLNRRGTTWRKLDAGTQFGVIDEASARELMLAQPSVIKRPVVDWTDDAQTITIGFDAVDWAGRLLPA
jgi:arsenate reductase (glutaredoxin)